MGVFVCSKCGCIDSTGLSDYWAIIYNNFEFIYEDGLEEFKGKPLCSDCGRLYFDDKDNAIMRKGEWHNCFEKRLPTDKEKRKIGKDGLIY